ncbi:MAG TPA: hypothetical protein VLI04_03150 [Nocardioidaceae bacterium]|nr:hypothetical protein [Nocardioidaceae bacterium]
MPIALGFVGLLLILQDALNLDVRAVVLVTILLTVIWTVMAVLAYRQYGANLRLVLSRRAWDPVALRMDDDLSRAAVESLLASGDLHDAETALDALVDADSPEVPRLVVSLLSSADPARRRLGAEVACTAHLWDSPGVPEGVEHLLGDGDRAVQLSAAAALAGRDERGQSLWMEAAGGDTASARVALEAAARCPDPFFVPHLVELGAWPSAPAELLDALVVHAEHLLPLARWMLGEPDAPRLTRRRLLSALGEAGIPGGRALLVEHLDDEDPSVAEAAARGLAAAGHRESPDTPRLARAVTSSAGRASRCFQVLSLLDDDEACESLRHALRDEIALSAQRAEVLLSLAHEPKAIAAGVAGLGADAEHDRNNALEMLEVTAGRRAARMLQAMTGAGLDDAARLRLLGEYCPLEARLLRDWLREIVVDRDRYWHEPWLQACALYALPSLLPAEAHSLAAKCVESADAVVAETARWVVGTVAPTV